MKLSVHLFVLAFAVCRASATIDVSLQMQLGNPSRRHRRHKQSQSLPHSALRRGALITATISAGRFGRRWDLTAGDVGDQRTRTPPITPIPTCRRISTASPPPITTASARTISTAAISARPKTAPTPPTTTSWFSSCPTSCRNRGRTIRACGAILKTIAARS